MAMNATETLERQLIERLLASLQELPEARAELKYSAPVGLPDQGYDAEIGLNVAGKAFTLLVEAKKHVFPRDVRQVLWQIKHYASRISAPGDLDIVPLLLAESISPGAKELLRSERVGYYDSGGSLFLPAPGAYLYIDKPAPKALSYLVRSLFSGSRAQVLHMLLMRHQDWFGVNDLAALAQVSPATASQVLAELDRFDWISTRGRGPNKERHLREPAALLDAWAKHSTAARPMPLRRYYVPGVRADELVDRIGQALDKHGAGYAISHEAAAQRYAPFLSGISHVRCRLQPGSSASDALAELDARPVTEGANLAIVEVKSRGELLFRERVGNVWLATPIQVYLDLLGGEGRAKEMAEHLRKERVGF